MWISSGSILRPLPIIIYRQLYYTSFNSSLIIFADDANAFKIRNFTSTIFIVGCKFCTKIQVILPGNNLKSSL